MAASVKPRWLVLAPHPDDAAISVGGALELVRRTVDLTLLTLVTRSSYSIDRAVAGDVERVSAIRGAEDARYARMIGARYVAGGITDSWIRNARTRDRRRRIYGPPPADVVRRFEQVILEQCRRVRPHVLLCPMGVGDHTDHVATRQATLRLLLRGRLRGLVRRVWLYEDLDYVIESQLGLRALLRALQSSGIGWDPLESTCRHASLSIL